MITHSSAQSTTVSLRLVSLIPEARPRHPDLLHFYNKHLCAWTSQAAVSVSGKETNRFKLLLLAARSNRPLSLNKLMSTGFTVAANSNQGRGTGTLAKLGSRLKEEFEKKDDKPKAEADNKDDTPKAEAGSGSGENNKSKAEADKVAGSGSGSAGAGLTTRSEVLALASTLFPLRATCAVKACDDSIGR